MNLNSLRKVSIVLCFVILFSGCALIGNETRILPVPDSNWKYAPENYFHDDMVKYDCPNFSIKIREVPIRSSTYFIGPLVPIIPILYTSDRSKEEPDLKIEIAMTNNTELQQDVLSGMVITDDKLKVHYGNWHKDYAGFSGMVYDIRRNSVSKFKLSFSAPIQSCFVPSLDFNLSDKTGLSFWVPGP